ncbi:MAG: hypothetical protein ACWGMZ_11575, partial [Thermoguttaceae bacterium]
HHIVYREIVKKDKKNWTAKVVTMWEATQRARQGLSIVERTAKENEKFIMSLSIGEMFQVDDDGGNRMLCVVRKITQTNNRIDYKLTTDARKVDDIKKDKLYFSIKQMLARNACKVTVDLLGRIHPAND